MNPELQRNIWLDFTFHRTIILPIVVVLFVYLFYLTGGRISSASVVFTLACLFIFVLGTKSASETVLDEESNHTWDFQRQSAISPWQMTWGKLLGSTIYNWYAALICLFFYAALHPEKPTLGFGFSSASLSVSHEIVLLILGGLFSQALALLFSLQILPQMRRERTNRSFRYFIAGMVLGALMTHYCFDAAKSASDTLSWHGTTFNSGPFSFYSLLIFLGWTIIGLQRSFCKELQYQNIPWIWALFNLFCIIYFSGFIPAQKLPLGDIDISSIRDIQNQLLNGPYYLAFIIAQALTYFALFTDTLSFIRYKYFITRLKERNVIEMLTQLPWWPISLAFTLGAGILVTVVQQQPGTLMENFSPSIFALTTILFLLRDIILVHFFNFAKNPRSPIGTSVLYLFILYGLLPLILGGLNMKNLVPMLLPSWGQNTFLAIISSGAQIAFLGMLCAKRYQALVDAAAEGKGK